MAQRPEDELTTTPPIASADPPQAPAVAPPAPPTDPAAAPMGPPDPFPTVEPTPEPMGPPDPFPKTEPTPVMGPPEPEVGPTQPTAEEQARMDRRKAKKQDKERVNDLLMERSRARRGLPPIDAEARAAIGSPEAAKAYREAPAAPEAPTPAQPGQAGQPAAQPGEVAQPGQAPAGPPKGGYQTGQTVQLTDMAGGQTSTQVYSMGGGIALPDGQGMSSDDFMQAFEQLNPGKSVTDAIQSQPREPGSTGNAARKILRDIGASGGAALSAEQQAQVEQALKGRTGELLRGHARGMAQNISSGATRLTAAEKARQSDIEEIRKREEDLRKKAVAAAEQRFKDPENFKSRAQLIEEEYATAKSQRDYIEGGDAAGVGGRDPDRITLDVKQVTRKADSIPSGQPEVSFNEQGLLEYTAKGLPGKLPAALVEAEGVEGGKRVVPIVENERQIDFLKPGEAYLDENGQLHLKGTPGRPKGEGGTGGTGGRGKQPDPIGAEKPGRSGRVEEEINLQKIAEEMRVKAAKDAESQIKPLQDEFADSQRDYQEALQSADGDETDPGVVKQKEILEDRRKRVEDARARVRERLEVTPEMAVEEAKRRIESQQQFAQAERDLRFSLGDEDIVEERINSFLPEGVQRVVTPQGNAMVVGDVSIPTSADDPNIPDPQTPEQIAALEASARGNVPTAFIGTTSSDAVGSSDWEEAGALRDSIMEIAKADQQEGWSLGDPGGQMTMVTGSDEEKMDLYTKAQDYARLKYGDKGDDPQVIEAVLEGLGFVPDDDPRADAARQTQSDEARNREQRRQTETKNEVFAEERLSEHYRDKARYRDALVETGMTTQQANEMANEKFGAVNEETNRVKTIERTTRHRELYGGYEPDEVNPYTGKPYAE